MKQRFGPLFSRKLLVMVDKTAGLAEFLEQCHARGTIEWDGMNRSCAGGAVASCAVLWGNRGIEAAGLYGEHLDPYVIRYPQIVAVADETASQVELIEFFDCVGGAMWTQHHYAQSPLVERVRCVDRRPVSCSAPGLWTWRLRDPVSLPGYPAFP